MRPSFSVPILAAVATGLAAFALLPQARSAEDNRVVLAAAPAPDMALLIVAVNKGFLAQEGLSPELKVFDSSTNTVQAVVAGEADVTENTEPPHLAARARGGKVVQVMTAYLSGQTNCDVVDGEAIKSHADFTGKTVAVQRGSGANFHLAWFLKHYNISADKVKVEFMATPDQLPALARKDIQAAFFWEPFCSRAAESIPNAKVFSRAADDGLEFEGNVLMREAIAKDDKAKAVKIVKGLVAASDWMNAHVHEAAEVANKVLKAPAVADVEAQLKLFKWPGTFMKSVVAQETSIAEWGAGIGLFPTNDPKLLVQQLIDPEVIKAAAPNRTDM
jgi:ABC-type nitrate/sulfonate/bicarbonate transport system substrate-binding protein